MEKDINFQVRQIAYNVYRFFKNRSNDLVRQTPDDDVYLTQVVAKVTGLPINTVTSIIEDGNRIKARDGVPKVPKVLLSLSAATAAQKNKYIPPNKQHIDEQTRGIIRQKVIRFYTKTNDLPTVQKINTLLRKEQILRNINNDNLRKVLLKLGFDFPDDFDAEIVERPDITLERVRYLQKMKIFRKANTNIFFMSETFYWHLKNEPIKDSLPNIIVVHASGPHNFKDGDMLKMRPKIPTPVDNASNSSSKTAIAAYHFADYTWVKDNVIPHMEPKSLIVLDSPLYEKGFDHSEETMPIIWRYSISALKAWLEKNNIPFVDSPKRATLVNVIKNVMARRDLTISKFLLQCGFSVIHLPQTHNELNPIRMVWEKESEDTTEVVSAFSLFEKYPAEKWQECFQDIATLEDEYIEMDNSVDVRKTKIKKEKMYPDRNLKGNSEIEPEDITVQLRDIKDEPEDITVEPKDIKEEPKDITEEEDPAEIMDDIKEEPADME